MPADCRPPDLDSELQIQNSFGIRTLDTSEFYILVNKLTICIFKFVKQCGLSLDLLSLLNESFAVLFSLFCSCVSSTNSVLTTCPEKRRMGGEGTCQTEYYCTCLL